MSQVSMCASNAIYILKHCNTEWLLCTAFKDCWLVTIVERCHSMLLCSQWSSDPLCTYRFSTSSMCSNVVEPVKCSAYERWCTVWIGGRIDANAWVASNPWSRFSLDFQSGRTSHKEKYLCYHWEKWTLLVNEFVELLNAAVSSFN